MEQKLGKGRGIRESAFKAQRAFNECEVIQQESTERMKTLAYAFVFLPTATIVTVFVCCPFGSK
jgi:hypothetical protein